MRVVLPAVLLAFLAAPASADEPAAPPPKAEPPSAPGVAAEKVELPHPATALAPGRSGEEVLVATDDGAVLRVTVGGGREQVATTGGERVEALAGSGDLVAAATLSEVQVFATKGSAPLWRTPRPVEHAFDPSGKRLLAILAGGEVVEHDAQSGKELARREVAGRRTVVKASVHPGSGLAVLGVADG